MFLGHFLYLGDRKDAPAKTEKEVFLNIIRRRVGATARPDRPGVFSKKTPVRTGHVAEIDTSHLIRYNVDMRGVIKFLEETAAECKAAADYSG